MPDAAQTVISGFKTGTCWAASVVSIAPSGTVERGITLKKDRLM